MPNMLLAQTLLQPPAFSRANVPGTWNLEPGQLAQDSTNLLNPKVLSEQERIASML
jgi:hypothetical protein